MGSATQPPPTTAQQPGQEPPRLSSTQKAYREDPGGFVERLGARANSLYPDGYTVRPASEPHRFLVAHTNPRDGTVTEYTVSAGEERCTCPFYARQANGERLADGGPLLPCKHLLGLPALVRETWRQHARDGNIQALTDLWRHWMVFVAARRRRRQIAEWTERRQQQQQRKEESNEPRRCAGSCCAR